jgi:hypothetical protein
LHTFERVALILLLLGAIARGQTTQGIISGRLVDSRTGQPIAGASIDYRAQLTDTGGVASSDPGGF